MVQLAEYINLCGSGDGHLVVFDREPGKKWEEKIFRRNKVFEGWKIAIWGDGDWF